MRRKFRGHTRGKKKISTCTKSSEPIQKGQIVICSFLDGYGPLTRLDSLGEPTINKPSDSTFPVKVPPKVKLYQNQSDSLFRGRKWRTERLRDSLPLGHYEFWESLVSRKIEMGWKS